jgi:uncharacterized protein (TIGR02996 family)
MTTDRDALIAAVVAHPDEDTPRLALADWLDEGSRRPLWDRFGSRLVFGGITRERDLQDAE